MVQNKRLTISAGTYCNNNCLFCYQRNNKKFCFDKTSEEIKKSLKDSKNEYTEVSFSNNEPTLRSDILDLISFAKQIGYKKIQVQTNGRTFYYNSFCKKMIDRGCNGFVVAIHGHNSRVHDFLTRSEGSFEQTLGGIKNLINFKQKVSTITTITKSNYKNLKQICVFLNRVGVKSQEYIFVDPTGNAFTNFYTIVPRIHSIIPYLQEMIDFAKEEKIYVGIKGIPYCLMSGYENYISEFYNETMDLGNLKIEDIFKFRSSQGKVKFEKCKKCRYYKKCEGIWKEYPKRYGYYEFNPIRNSDSLTQKNKITNSYTFEIISEQKLFPRTLLRSKKIKNKFVIVSDYGSFMVCNKKEFKNLLKSKIIKNDKLFKKMEQNYLVKTEKNKKTINNFLCFDKQPIENLSINTICITGRCNLGCVYCQAKSNPKINIKKDLNKKTAKKIIDFIFTDFSKKSKELVIEFQGGEPLIRFDIIKYIVNYTNKLNLKYDKKIKYIIGTNLTLMDEDKLKFIIENSIQISTSIDGPKMVHDANRPYPSGNSSFEDTIKWISKINKSYNDNGINKRVHSSPTFTKTSLGYLKEIANFYLQNNLDPIQSRFIDKIGYAKEKWKNIGYDPEQYIIFFKDYLSYLLELNKNGQYIRDRMIIILLNNIFTKEKMCPCVSEQCMCINSALSYDSNGDIYTCEYGRYPKEGSFKLGNVYNTTYQKILGIQKTKKILLNNHIFNETCIKCVWKPYCGICVFKRYYEGGTFKYPIENTSNCKVLMSQFDLIFEKIVEDPKNLDVFKGWLPSNSNLKNIDIL